MFGSKKQLKIHSKQFFKKIKVALRRQQQTQEERLRSPSYNPGELEGLKKQL